MQDAGIFIASFAYQTVMDLFYMLQHDYVKIESCNRNVRLIACPRQAVEHNGLGR